MGKCNHNKFVTRVNSIQCVDCYASFTAWAFINMYNKLQDENTNLCKERNSFDRKLKYSEKEGRRLECVIAKMEGGCQNDNVKPLRESNG